MEDTGSTARQTVNVTRELSVAAEQHDIAATVTRSMVHSPTGKNPSRHFPPGDPNLDTKLISLASVRRRIEGLNAQMRCGSRWRSGTVSVSRGRIS